MTYDDGIVGIYELIEIPNPGKKPKKALTLVERFFYSYDVLGINRYYTALEANQQIEAVINIPGWNEINSAMHVAILESGQQYRIQLVQPQLDDSGLRITKLSLERIHEKYDVIPGTCEGCPPDCDR